MWPRDRDWTDVVTSQATLVATRCWKRQGMDSPLEPSEEPQPCQNLGFSQPPELRENKLLLF